MAHVREDKYAHKILAGKPDGKGHLEDLGLDRIITYMNSTGWRELEICSIGVFHTNYWYNCNMSTKNGDADKFLHWDTSVVGQYRTAQSS